MPVTGNLQKDPDGLDESERQFAPVDISEVSGPVQVSDCAGNEVSSTTISPDPILETEPIHAENAEAVPVTVQSTTNVEMSSESLDGFKNADSPSKESPSKMSNNVASSVQFTKGFQDAFAAFASASFREDDEDAPADTNSEIDSKNEAFATVAADSTDAVMVEPLVTSASESGVVTTTNEESYVTQGQGSETALVAGIDQVVDEQMTAYQETEAQSFVSTDQTQLSEPVAEPQPETSSSSDSVYFIQTTDATGQVVTSIIDPNDIPAYADSIVYKQCMLPDGDIETTIVSQGGVPVTQEEQSQEQAGTPQEMIEQVEPQIIYVHDANGQLTPIDSVQSANDVAPPGKQFVYMQDSTGRIIRTVMDANQTMVPGQQVYYTQSEDGRIITSVMDSATAGVTEEGAQQSADQLYQQQAEPVYLGQAEAQQQTTALVGGTAGFNIDNSMSGLSMLAELSHLTAGQATDSRTASSTESNSMDMDEFRPVAMVTRRVGEEDAGLKLGETDSGSLDQDQGSSFQQEDSSGMEDSVISKLLAEMKVDQAPAYTVSRDNLFVQWQNLDAMCWMDVVLIMLVYSPTLRPLVNLDPTHELASTLLVTLLKANRQAQVLLQNLLKKSNGAEISGLQTGAGNTASLQDPKTSKLVCKENMDEIGKAINILYAMREKIWQALQPRLRCERGKHNSPVLVLPLLVREKPAIKQMFTMNYRYVFKCEMCGYSQDDAHTKILPSIPAVPADFNMTTPSFVRNCFECQAPNQRMLMKFEGLQDFVQMHFVKGLPHNRFEELAFDFNDDHFEVTAVVHYKNNPDHFIAWVRNAPGNTWMECDDLKSVITRYQHVSPNIPPSQVHMVLWERRLTAQHTLVMRDTEDTKLLASLVLTVQQPNTHQSTDPAARPTGAPSSQVPMYNTTQTNSLLSGLNAQNQTLSTFSNRGRGRGRGSRGSYVGRGRAAASTMLMPVRRATPTAIVPQLSSPTATSPRARATTQTIRVPISSLPGAVRSMNVGGDKIVLLSNNALPGSTSGSTSKVVVVRNQGGSSNLTAAQILQLLQRTGAISGGRVTTTLNTSSSSAPSSQSYIIQPDGSVVDAPSEAETTAQQTLAEPEPTTVEQPVETPVEVPMETGAEREEQACEETGQVVSQSEHQISTLSFSSATPEREQLSRNETIIVSPENASPSEAANESDQQVAGVKALLSQTQQQLPRYIQIPNPSGSGNILTQLTMRGGKMVLIPVNKNTQAQLTSTAVLKLPNSPSGSPKIAIRTVNNPQIVSASSAGALLSQLQQQQNQLSQMSGASTVSTVGGQKVITIPGSSGQKKTIQVITMPSSKQGASTNTSTPDGSRILTQSGSIVIRELKKDGDGSSAMSTPLAGSSQLVSASPAISLLKDVTARSGQSAASQQQKNQESFRYILQGSSTTHILHTGASAAQSTAGRTFTALSSSGTIIGGQLTPSPTTSASGTSPMDQDLGMADEESSLSMTPHRRLSRDIDTTEYIPLGRGRAKTRGGRGRGRGGRTPRGRGRSQLWSTDTDYIPPQQPSSRKISTLSSDLRQIGAHVIESSVEDVDGVPVVSIPDFTASEEANHHSDALSVPETLEQIHADQNADSTLSALSELAAQISSGESQEQQMAEATSLSPQGPRVITQAIPSIKANHGFDILTQGILAQTSLAQPKQARSLLTGSPVTIPAGLSSVSTVSSTTILDASEMISTVSKLPQALSFAQVSRTSEIDTLTEAALTAARPGSPARAALVSPVHAASKSPISTLSMDAQSLVSPLQQVAVYPPAGTFAESVEEPQAEEMEHSYVGQPSQESEEAMEGDERVVSVDESQVSAAERYRMPMELFQPDEESPEKPVKCAATDFPAKLFQDSEVSSQEEEMSLSPKGAARHKTIKEIELDKKASLEASGVVSAKTITHKIVSKTKFTMDNDSSIGDDVDIETTEKMAAKTKKTKQAVSTGVKKRGRKKLKADVELGTEGSVSSKSPLQENITQVASSPPKTKPKSANIGGFATDVLKESELEEKAKVIDAGVNEECNNEDLPELMKLGEDNVQSVEEAENKKPLVIPSVVKEVKDVEKKVCKEAEKVQRRKVLRPAAFVRHPKFKVDWCAAEDCLNKPRSFNYRVLLGKFKTSHHRHPSLARLPDDYTSPPSPLVHVFKEKPIVHRPPIVIRRIPKPLQSPAVDPSKEPTVIPLVAEDEGDPAYMGGCVVTSPIDGEIFNGVIVKKKIEKADWSSFLEEGEDEESLEEVTSACLEYCEHLLTEYYIAAVSSGDYTYLESCDGVSLPVDELVSQEEEEISDVEEKPNEEVTPHEVEKPTEVEKPVIEGKPNQEVDIEKETRIQDGKPNCEQNLDTCVLESPCIAKESQIILPARPNVDSPGVVVAGSQTASLKKKRGRPNREPSARLDTISHPEAMEVSSGRVNGMDAVSSSPAQAAPTADVSQSRSDTVAPPSPAVSVSNISLAQKEISLQSVAFPSPSRRSGRTPIPSKRVLDAMEDSPLYSVFKGRRPSMVSSDDEHSGYSTGESVTKKSKKNILTPS